jgi:2'-hydroxyisoflavone reductase
MRTLVLGGTIFVGRALTETLLAAGHDVTHFNRGRSGAADPRVRTIAGDRANEADLASLEGPWDAVFDTCGYLPQVVAKSVARLRDARRYVFVSSISVYAGPSCDEDAALLEPPDPLPPERDPETYGHCKTGCERVVQQAFGEHATIVRPGLIVGPGDYTDRFTYWVARVARGGVVAAPGRPERTVQLIDARDLADFMAQLGTRDVAGVYNATGPREPVTMATLLEKCRAVSGSDARFVWIPEDALAKANVAPWSDMPLWLPEADPIARLMAAPVGRAVSAGLAFRPLEATIADTLAWIRARDPAQAWKAGLTPERERALLAA